MRRLIVALTVVFSPLAAAAQSSDEAAAGQVLDALHAAAAKADGPAYFALYTPDAVFIGTDVSERWTLPQFRAYAAKPFAEGKGWTYTPRQRHVTLAPGECRCIAWFDEVLDSKSYGTSRGTGVLVKGKAGWRVAQYALTFPIPNDLADRMTSEIKAFEAKAKP